MYKSIKKIINLNPINKLYNTTIGDDKLGFVGVEDGDEPVIDEHYLYFEAVETGTTINITHYGTNKTTTKPNVMVSNDKENWEEWDGTEKTLEVGERLYLYGENSTWNQATSGNESRIILSKNVKCGGNIMTLLSQEGDKTVVPNRCFEMLFGVYANLLSAPKLPATTVGNYGYSSMFLNSAIEELPDIYATTLGNRSCLNMFARTDGQDSRYIQTPIFHGDKLFMVCYMDMFTNSTSLQKADLSFINGVGSGSSSTVALQNMFKNCSNLTEIHAPELEEWYSGMSTNWVSGVAETGVFYKKASLEIPEGTSGIPSGWTVINY